MTATLPVGWQASPWFGPRVFDNAALCPAYAAVALGGWQLPHGVVGETLPQMVGAWLAAASLLRELAWQGPTSAYLAGNHPIASLDRLAASVLRDESWGVRRFAVTAVENLLDAQAVTAPAPFDYVPGFIKTGIGSGEIHAGGAFAFAGPDGSWQVWRLRMTDARPPNEQSYHWGLVAAHVLAGHLDREQQSPLQTVQILEVGATTGRFVQVSAWDRLSLDVEFDALRQSRLPDMASDLRVSPGSHCAGCLFVGACPAAPRIDGLLGDVRRQPSVRKITASDLRMHADCPRRYRLLAIDGLPREALHGEAIERGEHIDAWLRHNHARDRGCDKADVQRLYAETGDERAAAMAAHHLGVCPRSDPSTGRLLVQPDVVALDSASRVLLVARPDATFQRDGSVIWRETKTHTTLKTMDARSLVETDVTAAVYVALLASGVTGKPDALEWEELSAERYELTILPADDAELVQAARTSVSAAIADLVSDATFPARVGPACADCPARRWCPDAP